MKKLMAIGFVGVMVAGVAGAQVMVNEAPAKDFSQTEVSAEAALLTSYVWRGQVLNNDFVFQPQLTASQYGVSLNVWGNYDFGKNYYGIENDFSELDISLAYSLPLNLNDIAFDVGLINYNYPANSEGFNAPSNSRQQGVNDQSVTELFAAAHWMTFQEYVIPSVTLFGNIHRAKGVYILFDVVAPYQISDYAWVEGGISAGWGDSSYNDYYWGVPGNASLASQDSKFNDFNFYASGSYEIIENVTASANVTYTLLNGGSIRDAAKLIYEDDSKLWAGFNIAYDF
jgi:hypothetical protein